MSSFATKVGWNLLQGPGAGAFEGLRGLLGSVPDNAFQRARVGESFDLQTRALAVILGGMKLFGVGFISSIGTLSVSNGVWAARKVLNPELTQKPSTKRSPIFKTAFVYGSFLGLSANLRYQVRFPAFPQKITMLKQPSSETTSYTIN